MHTTSSRLIFLAAGASVLMLVAASCSKTSADGESSTAGNGEYVMAIDPTVDGEVKAAAGTKAKLITDVALLREAGFGLSFYNGTTAIKENQTMTYSGSAWTHEGDPWKWPGNTVYTFCAWSPSDLTGITTTGGSFSSFTYTGIADQKDIMLGYYKGVGSPDGTNCKAPVKFSHALASVQFQVGTMTGLSQINRIKISGVRPQGTCTVTTATLPSYNWSSITGTAVELSQTKEVSTFTSGTAIGDPFLVLPQPLNTDNITVTLNVTPTSGSAKDITLTVGSGTLTPGKTTIYKINYDGITASFTVSVTGWTANDGGTVTVDEKQS